MISLATAINKFFKEVYTTVHDYFLFCRTQNKRYLYLAIGSSKQGSDLMLDWLEANWEDIKEFYGDTFVYNVANMVAK